MPSAKQQDYAFHPFYEKAKAIIENLGGLAMHPSQQSQLAYQIAQQMFMDQSNANRALSPLDPNNRPGLLPEALPASAPQQPAGPLTQIDQQQQAAPSPITF